MGGGNAQKSKTTRERNIFCFRRNIHPFVVVDFFCIPRAFVSYFKFCFWSWNPKISMGERTIILGLATFEGCSDGDDHWAWY
ncbi:uncharacterized protein LOC130825358 isoform X2 [Amaranthus tricolor]|uniref:uncharacterized protein LOC130825358 isoform X2 n=1 Tax=Amaranthus tricolor TaxID=29722 RepID=UPI0025859F87|nr:uncharacterized protein LOC130825358 isoform X2 [Amaranthus tricolor]